MADLDSISDERRRVVAEQRCLLLARDLMLNAESVHGIDGLIEKAKMMYTHQPALQWVV